MVKQIGAVIRVREDNIYTVPEEATHIGLCQNRAEFAFFKSDQTGEFKHEEFLLTPKDTPKIRFSNVGQHNCGQLCRLKYPEEFTSGGMTQMVSC